ncbi:hypothetical protein EC836_105266 [Erwinia sp. JUb26]|nr:hypothetical protein EC836_105266 [Erwinia sp. JUb26]
MEDTLSVSFIVIGLGLISLANLFKERSNDKPSRQPGRRHYRSPMVTLSIALSFENEFDYPSFRIYLLHNPQDV